LGAELDEEGRDAIFVVEPVFIGELGVAATCPLILVGNFCIGPLISIIGYRGKH
jgi:hypothetical protein